MIDSLIYDYIDKNFTLKYRTSKEICYIYDINNEPCSRVIVFDEIKNIFSLEEDDFFHIYTKWVTDKKEAMLMVC